ncbi:MAG: DUF370 domain-containing protein [Deltaproteobacteria bacterium]|nr:MAG: DUF370 domain-containing protein [Deltaproteobacteria bacterium]
MKLLNVGYGNLVPLQRLVAVLQPQSAPVKRLREEAASSGKLLDATQGRRTRAVLVLDSGHVVLSAVQAHTLAVRADAGSLLEVPAERCEGNGG